MNKRDMREAVQILVSAQPQYRGLTFVYVPIAKFEEEGVVSDPLRAVTYYFDAVGSSMTFDDFRRAVRWAHEEGFLRVVIVVDAEPCLRLVSSEAS